MPPVLAIIPARYASTRLPGKPLLDRSGQPLIQHVVEAARAAERVTGVIVATDDPRIRDAVVGFGGIAVMTAAEHPNGTARIAEALTLLDPHPPGDAIVVNVQGDEPDVEPRLIDALVDTLIADADAPMATLASPFADDEDPQSEHIVKLVTTAVEPRRALYFSRRLIPFVRSEARGGRSEERGAGSEAGGAGSGVKPSHAAAKERLPGGDEAAGASPPLHTPRSSLLLKHPGLYAYRRDFLPVYAGLAPTPLEQAERLEQLRALEHGYPIAVCVTPVRHHGIDTPEQYDAWLARQAR
mgnify:CR=1 FL=1